MAAVEKTGVQVSDIYEAVSAVLVCGEELFIIHRQYHLRAFPGFLSFPGGKVDPEDFDGDCIAELDILPVEQAALRRELIEELGWDWFAARDRGEVLSIEKIASALAPPGVQIRFNNHFFRIVLTHKPAFVPDSGEIRDCGWHSAADIVERYEAGEFFMVSPTRVMMHALRDNLQVRQIEFGAIRRGPEYLPVIDVVHQVRMIPVPSNTLPPASTTTALYLGDDDAAKILVDPSPKNTEVLQSLLKTLDDLPVDAILLSHHHPDHHELSVELARTLAVPMLMSATTRRNIERRFGQDYFHGVTLREVVDGEVLTAWKGQAVSVIALPGHDDGMVGLRADNLAWVFVADLVQPGTTVVIPEDGGDMKLYCETLAKVIALSPRAVIPSHGSVQVGTHILETTLEHRHIREKQILQQWEHGHRDEAAILEAIYPKLPDKLKALARQNIRQHLKKLRVEQRLPGASGD